MLPTRQWMSCQLARYLTLLPTSPPCPHFQCSLYGMWCLVMDRITTFVEARLLCVPQVVLQMPCASLCVCLHVVVFQHRGAVPCLLLSRTSAPLILSCHLLSSALHLTAYGRYAFVLTAMPPSHGLKTGRVRGALPLKTGSRQRHEYVSGPRAITHY